MILGAALLALVGPGAFALVLVLAARAFGCSPDAASCGDAPIWLQQALDIAWPVALDLRILGALTAIVAVAAPFAAPYRASALATGAIATASAPTAAFVLPHAAVILSLPAACRLNEASSAGCPLWGHDMGLAYGYAGAAFWLVLLIAPLILAGVILTLIVATFRPRKPA